MMIRAIAVGLLAATACAQAEAPDSRPKRDQDAWPLLPDTASAAANAHHIFNQLNSAGRQWGSALTHNGVGFFPAVVPAGTLLYHGQGTNQPPTNPEWLAFDVEHAEFFAVSRRRHDGGGTVGRLRNGLTSGHDSHAAPAQKPVLGGGGDDDASPCPSASGRGGRLLGPDAAAPGDRHEGGYLHTYQASRNLRVLYLDGMAAAKTAMGTLDSQDLVLCEGKIGNRSDTFPFGERERVGMICEMLAAWGYDGLVRMEAGFELVHCDFGTGLSLLSARRTLPPRDDVLGADNHALFMGLRAAAEHYDGVGGQRLRIDYSSMVSGWLFAINLTNTDPDRPDLARLGSATQQDLRAIKRQVARACTMPRRFTVDWQATTDMIVKRFSRRLLSMTSPNGTLYDFVKQVESATLMHMDAPRRAGNPPLPGSSSNRDLGIERCTEHLLLPAKTSRDLWAAEDELIHLAIETVIRDICTALFSVRAALLRASPDAESGGFRIDATEPTRELREAVGKARHELWRLTETLGWSELKKVSPCRPDEIMLVAMWPTGDDEDHFHPGCVKMDDLNRSRKRYWEPPRQK